MNDHPQSSISDLTILEAYKKVVGASNAIFKKWWIILVFGIAGGIVGIIWATQKKPNYEAKLTFSLEDNGGGLTGALSIAADFGFNLGSNGNNAFSGDNIINILMSRRIIEQVLLSSDTILGKPSTLANRFMEINQELEKYTNHKRLGTIRFPPGVPRERFSYYQDSVLYEMYEGILKTSLKIGKPDKKLNMYEVDFVSHDERFSKVFTEQLVMMATDFYTETRVKRSRETVQILEQRVAAMRGNARSAIKESGAIKDANLNPAVASQGAEVQQRQVDVSAFGGAYAELFKNLELARYQYLKDVPLMQVIDTPRLPIKKQKMGRLKAGLIGGFLGGIVSIVLILFINLLEKLRSLKRRYEVK